MNYQFVEGVPKSYLIIHSKKKKKDLGIQSFINMDKEVIVQLWKRITELEKRIEELTFENKKFRDNGKGIMIE